MQEVHEVQEVLGLQVEHAVKEVHEVQEVLGLQVEHAVHEVHRVNRQARVNNS